MFVQPTITHQVARKTLEFRWWHRFRFRRRKTVDPTALPRLEIVYLPYYLFTIDAHYRDEVRQATATVEAHSGSFSLFDEKSYTITPNAEHPSFPPALPAEEAAEIARNGVAMALLRSRGKYRRSQVGRIQKTDLLGYPFWVYYYERRRKRLDFKVLDAVTGRPPGTKVKPSLLAAFIAARQKQ
jgi:hypothetical protein